MPSETISRPWGRTVTGAVEGAPVCGVVGVLVDVSACGDERRSVDDRPWDRNGSNRDKRDDDMVAAKHQRVAAGLGLLGRFHRM